VARSKYSYDSKYMHKHSYDATNNKNGYGYDDFVIDIMDFEFISTDKIYFEEKTNQYGNVNFYMKGFDKMPKGVFAEDAHCMHVSNVYGGTYILGCNKIIDYGRKANVPKNMYDITRAKLSYSVVATNMRKMMPKSMVDSCTSFADQIQLTHLKIQQAIAKAKPDGLIIDIEALENVQLGKGGELQPLELHDIYEQTGVFYYRGKNPDGSQQAPPIREIGNSIRNINEMIALYNHYMRMIRDVTGVNEAMDASTPKGDALVGVQQIAIQSGNNAIYDITNASAILYKKVCQDIVKCLQIIHPDSILFSVYEKALGKNNMQTITEFRDLPMYNFGVIVEKDMEEKDRQFLEQNIQVALGQKEIDLEDAMAVRQLKDVTQAEKVLMVRRKKRREAIAESAKQQQQAQAQAKMQEVQAQMQAKQQEMQLLIQAEVSKIGTKMKADMQLEQMRQEHEMKIMEMKLRVAEATRQDELEARKSVERMKDNRKDDRVKKQAIEQSKLISQRQGQRGELKEESNPVDFGQALANQAITQK